MQVKNLLVNAGETRDADSIPGPGRSSGEGNGNPFHYSCQENLMAGYRPWSCRVKHDSMDTTALTKII